MTTPPTPLSQALSLAKAHPRLFSVDMLGHESSQKKLPIAAFSTGCQDPMAPMLILIAGLRGNEPVGPEFLLGWMDALRSEVARQRVDALLTRALLVFIPAANPWGLAQRSRYNSQGIDLACNAPVDSSGPTSLLFGGHRLAPWLPGFRGKRGAPMQTEAQALVDFVLAQSSSRRHVLVVDCVARRGQGDRLWFPSHHTSEPMPWLPLMMRFKNLLESKGPASGLGLTPRWHEGLSNGSIWDHVLRLAPSFHIEEGRLDLLTLGMGRRARRAALPAEALLSNPASSAFHFRAPLAEALMVAAATSAGWMDIDPSERSALLSAALDAWWTDRAPPQT